MKLKQWASVLWPGFLIAGVADVLLFTLFDPTAFLYQDQNLFSSRFAAYSIGFFIFWILGAAASMLTCYFLRGPDQINR